MNDEGKVGYDQLLAAMERGCTVEVDGVSYRRGAKLPKDTEDKKVQGVISRDPDGRLTYHGMVALIRRGESVMYEGAIITSVENLPHPIDVARDDMGKLREEERALLARRKLIEDDEKMLRERMNTAARAQSDSAARAAKSNAGGGKRDQPGRKQTPPAGPGQTPHAPTQPQPRTTPPPEPGDPGVKRALEEADNPDSPDAGGRDKPLP